MSSVTSGGDNRKIYRGCRSSSLDEEGEVGGNMGGEVPLKKGPWTAAEDAILLEYVNKHGQGNWNAVQKYSGLARCGKSCRLRWANHLRPDLKKGAFTEEEENRILELHAKMGNKWARMAAEMSTMYRYVHDSVALLQKQTTQYFTLLENPFCLSRKE